MRGLYLFEYSHFLNFDLAIGADVGEYISRAREILNCVFLPAAPEIQAPLYSFLLVGILSSGGNIVAIRIIQTLLNYISWTALYWLMGKKGISHQVRLVFFGLSMVLAPIIFHPAELISEALLLPIYTLVFIMLHCSSRAACKKKEYLYGSAAGVFSAMAALTHGLSLAFIVLTAIYLFILKKWQNALLYLAGSIVILLPVIAVKSSFYGKTTFLQANSGFNIFLGNNPKANGECYMRPGNVWRKSHVQAAKKAAERSISTDRYWLEQAFDFWKKTPGKAAILYKNKFISIFSGKELIAGADGGFLFCRSDSMNLLRFLTFPVFCFAIAGLWYIFKSRKEPLWWPPLILTLALFIMQMLTVTSGRYRLLMFPGIIYLAAAGITYVNWRKIYLLFILILLLTVWKTYNFLGKDKAEGSALLGEAAFIKGDLAHAGELLLFASKRFKDSSRVENMLGMIAEKQGDLKTAEK